MYLYEIGDSLTIPDRCKTPKVCPTVQFDTGLGGDEASITETITCAGDMARRPSR